MNKKVIVAGHICVDITPAIHGKGHMKIGDLLQPGKLIEVGKATVSTGGAVANTGLAMKILGANVTLMGKVGTDAFGDIVCRILNRYEVEDGCVRDEDADTSYTVVVAVPGNDRCFLHDPGANNTFCADDIPQEKLEGAALFHFGYPPLMRKMYEDDGVELVRLLEKVKAAGCAVSLDLAAVSAGSDADKADWKKILEKTIPMVDFFVPSAEELCYMLDRPRFEDWERRACGGDITDILELDRDIRPLAEQCMKLGAKVLLIKCGARGMYYRTADAGTLQKIGPALELCVEDWADKEGFERSYVPDQILSGTGAGDTSIAAFLTGMINGETVEECMHLAAGTGACCVAAYDSLSGLLSMDDLKKKIASGWEKQISHK